MKDILKGFLLVIGLPGLVVFLLWFLHSQHLDSWDNIKASFSRTIPTATPPLPSSPEGSRLPKDSQDRYRLYATQNIWSFLLLDSATGRVWQCQFSTEDSPHRFIVSVSDKPLVPEKNGRNSRFVLHETRNIWNFLLLDTEGGKVWQCQFGRNPAERFVLPLNSTEQ